MRGNSGAVKLLVVDEDRTNNGNTSRPRQEAQQGASESGWVSTEDAASTLGVSPRTIREYIRSRTLDAKSEGTGVLKRWLVSEDSVRALLEKRHSTMDLPRNRRELATGALLGAENTPETESADVYAEPTATLQNLQYRLGYTDAQLEYSESVVATLQTEQDRLLEDLKRERERAERERAKTEEIRLNTEELTRQESATRQKADRLEWEREESQEEIRRLREELEAERSKSLKLMGLAGILLIILVAATAATMAILWAS
jgi:chromosome segregation ATPase